MFIDVRYGTYLGGAICPRHAMLKILSHLSYSHALPRCCLGVRASMIAQIFGSTGPASGMLEGVLYTDGASFGWEPCTEWHVRHAAAMADVVTFGPGTSHIDCAGSIRAMNEF